MATNANSVRGTFQTDPISALGLASPVSIGVDASVGAALEAVQTHRQGYVLVVEDGRPRGIMSEREVLHKIVSRSIAYGSNVMSCTSPIPATLQESETIASAIQLMVTENIEDIPVVDSNGRASAVLRTLDVINFLAEAFPTQVLNLPPRPHQTMPQPEGG